MTLFSAVPFTTAADFQAARDNPPTKPGVVSFTVTSDYQSGPNPIEVLCPDDMDPSGSYPVLVVLPVNTGLDGQWGSPIEELRRNNIHNMYQVVCVVPSYDIDPWYGDMPTAPANGPFIRQQAYVTDVVIPLIEREFPVRKSGDSRYLIGFSKSGFGAFGLILRNPEVFNKAAVFDCADPNPQGDIFEKWGMARSYGTRENFDQNFAIPALVAKQKAAFQGPSRRLTLLAGSLTYCGVEAIHQAFKDNKVAYTYVVFPGMAHTWKEGWLPVAAATILPIPSR